MTKKTSIAAVAAAVLAAGTLASFSVFADEQPAAAPADTAAPAQKISTPEGWLDDFEAAKTLAAAENKALFVLFTGSDWCIWCKRLADEVLSQPGFLEKISENYVPVFIDLPQDKSLLSDLAKTQNPDLTDRYRVRGFPTVLLLDADGIEFAKTGYVSGGPENYLAALNKVAEDGKNSDAYKARRALKAVPAGPDRVKKLDEMLSALPFEEQLENMDGIEEILAADPDGSLGYRAKYPFFAVVIPLGEEFNAVIAQISLEARKMLTTPENPNGLPKDQKEAFAALEKVVKANPEPVRAVRAKAQKGLELFAPDSVGATRLKIIINAATQILQKTGVEPAGNSAPEKKSADTAETTAPAASEK